MSQAQISNVVRAAVFRCAGYIFPLVTIPMFARLLAPETYGRLGVALTFCSILQAFCEGGQTIGGAKRLACAASIEEQRSISLSIYKYKAGLLLISLLAGIVYSQFFEAPLTTFHLFMVCFIVVVIPDAITPQWVYQSQGNIGNLSRQLFISRAISFPAMIGLIWFAPNETVGAIATGLPFIIFAVTTIWQTRVFLPTGPITQIKNFAISETNFPRFTLHLGTIAATILPAVIMQTVSFAGDGENLGLTYLTVSLWVACRQMCILPNQSQFHLVATARDDDQNTGHQIWRAALFGSLFMAAIGALAYWLAQSIIPIIFGEAYVGLTQALVPMLLSGILFAMGHGIALNRLAATGRNSAFALCYGLSLSSFVITYISLSKNDNQLAISVFASDLSLLMAAVVFTLRARGRARA